MTIAEIVAKLRLWAETSTSKGKVLAEAADLIERMEADLKQIDPYCRFCKHSVPTAVCTDTDFLCDACPFDCHCKDCRDNSKWEYRAAIPADCKQAQVTEPLRPNGLPPL